MSRICTSQEWFNSVCVCACVCVHLHVCECVWMCTWAETCMYMSQDFLSYTWSRAALSSQNNAANSILSAARYNLFQSSCLAVQITARQPTIASSVYYHQQANCQIRNTSNSFNTLFSHKQFFTPAYKSQMTITIACTRKPAFFWCQLKSP